MWKVLVNGVECGVFTNFDRAVAFVRALWRRDYDEVCVRRVRD